MKKLLLCPDDLGKVIVLAPHCDDEVLGCGGMLLRCLKNGNQCRIIFLTNELRSGEFFRHLEVMDAWKAYPQLEHIFLNIKDSSALEHIDLIAQNLASILETYQPDSIFLPWPFDQHPDHRAVFKAIYLLNIKLDSCIYFYEIFFPLYSNCTMNITNVFEEKAALVEAYVSQRNLNLKNTVRYLNLYRAAEIRLSSVKAAEAFCAVCTTDIGKLMEQINMGFRGGGGNEFT